MAKINHGFSDESGTTFKASINESLFNVNTDPDFLKKENFPCLPCLPVGEELWKSLTFSRNNTSFMDNFSFVTWLAAHDQFLGRAVVAPIWESGHYSHVSLLSTRPSTIKFSSDSDVTSTPKCVRSLKIATVLLASKIIKFRCESFIKPELFLVFAVWQDASQEGLILKERCFSLWRWQLLGIRGWWMISFVIPNSCVTPDGQKQSGVGILRPRASWTGTEKSLQDFKNQCNITGTLAICAAWRFAVCTTSRNPTIAPVPAGKYFALYMQWLGPIQLSWTNWILKNHFFATAMLLFTTQHIIRLSHQNVCSGSKMLRTLKRTAS